MLGVVDVGGGTRGAYGAGVLDGCLDRGVSFGTCVGVSAGAANVVSYLAGQRGRNLRFYTIYQARGEYLGLRAWLRSGSWLDLGYVYGTLTVAGGEDPLDFPAMAASGAALSVVATRADTGTAAYFGMEDFAPDDYAPLRASSCIPLVCRPQAVDGAPYFDGGLADPIPVDHALSLGCERVAVILTRPRDHYRTPDRDVRLARLLRRRWPAVARALEGRAEAYNRGLGRALALEAEGRALVVAPPREFAGMPTLTNDASLVRALYERGVADAGRVADWTRG